MQIDTVSIIDKCDMLAIYRILFAVGLVSGVALFLTSLLLGDNRFHMIAIGHVAIPALIMLPIAARVPIKPAEPFNLVVLYVLVGTVGNAYILGFTDSSRRNVLMNGEPLEVFIGGGMWLLLGLFVMGAGYTICRRRIPVERYLPHEARLSNWGIHLSAWAALVFSIVATMIFIQSTGGISSLAAISKKRAIEIMSDGEIVFANAGYLRLVAGLPMLYLYIMLSYYLKRRHSPTFQQKVLLLLLLMGGIAIPFVASSRASIAYSLIGLVLVYSAYRQITIRSLVAAGMISLSFFSVMTGLRTVAHQNVSLETGNVVVNPVRAIAESGNGISLNGTGLILDGVPERMDFKLGYTFVTWLVSPIPRSIWPGKPDISLGKEIKQEILGQNVIKSGRPPSFLTEGYINFGFPGFFLCAFAFGYFCRLSANSFLPLLKENIFACTIYFALMLHIAALSNGAFSQAMVRILSDLAPIYFIYKSMQFLSFNPMNRRKFAASA